MSDERVSPSVIFKSNLKALLKDAGKSRRKDAVEWLGVTERWLKKAVELGFPKLEKRNRGSIEKVAQKFEIRPEDLWRESLLKERRRMHDFAFAKLVNKLWAVVGHQAEDELVKEIERRCGDGPVTNEWRLFTQAQLEKHDHEIGHQASISASYEAVAWEKREVIQTEKRRLREIETIGNDIQAIRQYLESRVTYESPPDYSRLAEEQAKEMEDDSHLSQRTDDRRQRPRHRPE